MARKRKIAKYRQQQEPSAESPRVPDGAVAADPSQQGPFNSYSGRPTYYVDKPFNCVDCGAAQVWTAQQQKWYYEVAKGSMHATAVRCRACRRKRWETLGRTGDRNPIKGPHSLMKRIERAIAAAAAQAGFGTATKVRLDARGSLALDYRNGESILTCSFDKHAASLSAEMMVDDQVTTIVNVPLDAPRNQVQLLEKIQAFTSAVSVYLTDFAKP